MAGIKDYSTTNLNNTSLNGISVAEGMLPSNLNNAIRALMVNTREWFNDSQWVEYGDGDGAYTAAYASATSFTIAGVDVSAIYHEGRRIKLTATTPGTIYGTISSSSFSTNTTVNVTWDSGSLSNETIDNVYIGALSKTNNSLPTGVIATATLADGSITTVKIAADAVNGSKIADDSIDSEHYVDGSIDTAHIADSQITTAKIANSNVTNAKLASNAVATSNITDLNVTTAKIAADAINGSKIADDSIDSEHIVDGSIDTAHIGNTQVTFLKMAANSIDSDQYIDGSIDTVHIGDSQITNAKMASDSVDSDQYVDGSIDTAHIGDSQVTTAKIADSNVTAAKLGTDSVVEAKIQNSAVTTNKINDDAVTAAKIADAVIVTNSEQSGHTPDDVTFFTTSASDGRYFRQDSSETIDSGDTWSSSDAFIATTAAIDARVIDLVDDIGGFVPIANETSFPNTNPDVNDGAGTIVSIASISSTRTPSGGTVTISGGTLGGSTVTITGCGSTVLTAGFGVLVETTTTLNTYTFHRLVPKATEVTTVASISSNITTVANDETDIGVVAGLSSDIQALADIEDGTTATNAISNVGNNISSVTTTAANITGVNSFAERYRVVATNPTTSLDAGDLAFVTGDSALKFYDGTSWTSIAPGIANVVDDTTPQLGGNLDLNSKTINGTGTINFTGDVTATNIAGAGASITALNASNLASGTLPDARFPATLPAASGSNLTALNASNLASGTVPTARISGAYTGITEVGTLTGLTTTGNISFGDNDRAQFGAGNDLQIYHTGNESFIRDTGTGILYLDTNGSQIDLISDGSASTGKMARFVKDGAVELYHDNSKKLETTSSGVDVTGNLTVSGNLASDGSAIFNESGADVDFRIESDTINDAFFLQGSDGKIGLATQTPVGRLHLFDFSGSGGFRLTRSDNITGVGMHMQTDSARNFISSYGDLVFKTNTTGDGTNASERFRIREDGIGCFGTTSSSGVAGTGLSIRSGVVGNSGTATLNLAGSNADFYAIRFASSGFQIADIISSTVDHLSFRNSSNTTTFSTFDDGTGYIKKDLGVGTSSPNATIHAYTSDSGVSPNAYADDLFIESSGNTGLTIGSGTSSYSSIYFANSTDNDKGRIEVVHSDNSMRFTNNAGERMRISSNGLVRVANTSHTNSIISNNFDLVIGNESSGASGLAILAPNNENSYVAFFDNDNSGSLRGAFNYNHNDDSLRTYVNGSERMRITSGGNLGINTTSPSQKLHVSGHIASNGLNLVNNTTSPPSGVTIHQPSTNVMAFRTNSTERVRIDTSGHVLPGADNTQDLGSTSLQWRNIYTGDLHLSNERHEEGNSVDGTTGNWTIQEGAEDLYILNNKTGKKFKFKLEEIN